MKHLRLILSLSLIFFVFASSIPHISALSSAAAEEANADDEADGEQVKDGLQFRLSQGAGQPETRTNVPVAETARLTDAEVQGVFKRLPPIKAEGGDQQEFALRDKSLPPPRTGRTVNVSFPSSEPVPTPDQRAAGPLEVLRFSPEGEVPLAPQLSITFSQPMVAITSVDDLAAGDVPVRLSPQPPGKWRWVGTRTLLYVPDNRLPMATEFTATVPAGTKSANGGTIATTKTWKFATPPPQVRSSYPYSSTPTARDQLMFVEFDQRIDPAAVLRTIKVQGGSGDLKIRLATEQEIAADKVVSQLAKAAESGRWLAFRAVTETGETATALPADSSINIQIGPGTPSAEGPRTTVAPQNFVFRTYGPFRVTEHKCGYSGDLRCSPFDQWIIMFSNPVDADAFDQAKIRVEPEVPGLKVSVYGQMMYIDGVKRGRTTYKLTIDRSLKDQFNQTLGSDVVLTFNVGPAPPSLVSSGKAFVVLDPSAPRTFSVYSVNHKTLKVRLYKVQPEDWEKFVRYMRFTYDYYEDTKQKQTFPPGTLVSQKTVAVKGQPEEMTETRLELAPALDNGLGHVVIVVEAGAGTKKRERQSVEAWVQSTNIGLSAFVDNADLYAWTTSLKEGKPLSGVQLRVHPLNVAGESGMFGIARIPLKTLDNQGSGLLIARQGRDVAFMPEHEEWWNTGTSWYRRAAEDALRWFVFDDRKMYRPGEEVHLKGWIRKVEGGKLGDVDLPGQGVGRTVSYAVRDSQGNEVLKGSSQINALGGFDTNFKLPGTMNLGYAYVQLQADQATLSGGSQQHYIQVQEFRRPEFEVKSEATEGPHFVKGFAETTVSASYYAGGGLPNAEVNWRVTSQPTVFTPPNRQDFTFGEWVPWWRSWNSRSEGHTETFGGRTDAAGKHRLRIDFDSVNPPRASSVTAVASVTDVNRQQWASSSTLLVHPADLYVGLRSPRTFVQQGEPLVVEAIVTDLDGKAVANREIKMRAVMLDWVYEKGKWQQKEKNPQDCTVQSGADVVKCTFTPKLGGMYRVTARIQDDRERPNESALTLWVAGGKQPPKRDVEQETVEMIPDKREYKAGETAEILIQAPFAPAEGVLTLRRSGILKTERFQMDGPSHTLRIPIEEAYTPNLHVQVDLTGMSARTDDKGQVDEKLPKRPAFAKGQLNLQIPPIERKLTVSASPRDGALEPGAETVVNVEVKDAEGRGVAGSEVALVVVDEAILSLTGYRIGDPLYTFYAQRGADATDHHLRASILLGNPEDVLQQAQNAPRNGRGYAGGVLSESAPPPAPVAQARRAAKMDNFALADADEAAAKGGEENEAIRLRENFNALAVFAPTVPTDASGRAQVKVKVPDNLTRYRVMAVSVAGGRQFGSGESVITARLPLM
ncbi:MAG TPA: MG2 domain-containing protein, partial [Pyrinomonadaceae bacterium]|nr:MG2 domain-containing protein [Pyrinomonadaceae bacterium]